MLKTFSTLILALLIAVPSHASDVKKADLAGSWYPSSKAILASTLNSCFEKAPSARIDGELFAFIVPHAGYQFSGPVAARAFKAVRDKKIDTVIVLGFSHKNFFNGISVYDRGSFATPLGDIQVDSELARELISKNPRMSFNPELFYGENSIEMQLPLIKFALPDARIVPVVFGTRDFEDASVFADALASSLKGKNGYLVMASTDLSHYHPYDEAVTIDNRTISLISKMKAQDLYDEAMAERCELCGLMPVTSLLLAAENLGYDKVKVLDAENSGDTYGDRSRVVGYVAAAVYRDSPQSLPDRQAGTVKERGGGMLNDAQKKRLLQIARESIRTFVTKGERIAFKEADPALNREFGAFVTLHKDGQLRGCIGSMVGQGPLCRTIADMAIEAATGDPRFRRLSSAEIDKVDIEISVLSPLKRVKSYEEIRIPGDGVLVRKGFSSGIYLPQVATETGWNRDQFLTSLCASKAGIDPQAWRDPSTEMYVFTAEVFGEKG
jgi:AmmeMemoRadiSam system protein B/AmmeMemoRadiSam system protein A